MPSRERRLQILDEQETRDLFERPQFDDEQRSDYFSLSNQEEFVLQGLHSLKSRCLFILQLGYFKHSYQFFRFEFAEVHPDVVFIQDRYFPHASIDDLEVTKVTRLKQQKLILDLFNFRTCRPSDRNMLAEKARQAARISSNALYILRELMEHLNKRRLVSPAYSSMQDIIGQALNAETERLGSLLEKSLSEQHVEALQNLLDDSEGLHNITRLKHQPKNFDQTELRREVQREQELRELYKVIQELMPTLSISNESVVHYAELVDHYTVFRLKRMKRWIAYLYLLCYIRFRYQKLNDNLIISFKHHLKRYNENAEEAAKERVYQLRIEANQNVHKAAQVLELVAKDMPADTLFSTVQQQAFRILPIEQLEVVGQHLRNKVVFDETAFAWDYLDSKASSFKGFLRHAIRASQFEGGLARDPVVTAVAFLKATFTKERPLSEVSAATIPQQHIAKGMKRYLFDDAEQPKPKPDRYEYHVYQLLKQGLDKGDIHCRDSVRFRSLEDDLISSKDWHRDKHDLIAELDLPILSMPIEDHLCDLKQQLESRLLEVNQRIADGDNEHFKRKKSKGKEGWILSYPKLEKNDEVNHAFYGQLQQTDVRLVLEFAQEKCGFMHVFEHLLGRYSKSQVDHRALNACLIAWGSNMGLGKMSEISDLSFQTLTRTSQNFIRLETLKAANDIISNQIADLPIFKAFNLDNKVHSSSDGQRFESQWDTFNARYAYRYFGKRKGVVSYTVVANHVPINAFMIGADEHESHYVFDGLFNNSTAIKPEIHSTDSHGSNELNFALLHVFGYQFAPRFKDIRKKLRTSLYGFQHPSQYPELTLKPIRKLRETLIGNEWDNMLRVFVSLAYKSTTQSIIVGKFSSYARVNTTKKALWEYDNIIRSLYLLDFVDLPILRQGVQTAINRGENYHQLKRAVSYANFGRLRYHTEQDQAIWNACSQLITNCIIYFNSTLLNTLVEAKEKQEQIEAAKRIKAISPVAWQHINFAGRYEFQTKHKPVDIHELLKGLL